MLRKKRLGRAPHYNEKLKIIVPSEYQECKVFWEYCQVKLKLGMHIYHIPNEGKRDKWYANALVNIGLTPGIIDYHYIPRNGKYLGWWVDMKRIDERGKKTDPNQDACIEMLLENGHYASYAYGATEAIQLLTDYRNNRL